MGKEVFISIFIIGLIIIGNVITQNNTKQSIETMSNNLYEIREELIKDKIEQAKLQEQMENTNKNWKEYYERMAYYIEHDELEKVETELTKLKANIDTKEYLVGVESLDNCIFILKHIRDKNSLKIVNIF